MHRKNEYRAYIKIELYKAVYNSHFNKWQKEYKKCYIKNQIFKIMVSTGAMVYFKKLY